MSLKEVKTALSHIACSPSTKLKEQIIKKCLTIPHFKTVCYYALNPFYSYNIREIKPSPIRVRNGTIDDIFVFLDQMRMKRGASDKEKMQLSRLASFDQATVDVVNYILNKDLRCGAGVKIFRKAGLDVPVHEVCLCIDKYDKFIKEAKTYENVCASVKLDGVRVWCIVQPHEIKYVSRNGKEYPNFSCFDNDIINLVSKYRQNVIETKYPFIFDGEVISSEKNFQKQMQQVRRLKGADTSKFEFHIFDWVTDNIPFYVRYETLKRLITDEFDTLQYVLHTTMGSKGKVDDFLLACINSGEEGIILKTWNGLYEYKRSNAWCKMKMFHTEDLKVKRWEYGEGKYENVMGVLVVDRNGVEVKVGSGFSDKQRTLFMTDTPEMIEVKYQEVTEDGSLRFPTFVVERGDK